MPPRPMENLVPTILQTHVVRDVDEKPWRLNQDCLMMDFRVVFARGFDRRSKPDFSRANPFGFRGFGPTEVGPIPTIAVTNQPPP